MKRRSSILTSVASRVRRRIVGEPSPAARLAAQIESGDVVMGAGSYGLPYIKYWASSAPSWPFVTIGRYCSIASNVTMLVDGNHRTDWVTTYPIRLRAAMPGAISDGHPEPTGPIRIGNDV